MEEMELSNSNLLNSGFDVEYHNAGGRRNECASRGLTGAALRKCRAELRKEDKNKTKDQKKEDKKNRKDNYNAALNEGKVRAGKGGRKVAKYAGSPIRAAYLLIISLNVWNLAGRLKAAKDMSASNPKVKKSWNKSVASYVKAGGKVDKFTQAIEKGANKKPLIIKLKKKKGFDGSTSFDFIGEDGFLNVTGVETAITAAAASSPIWIPTVAALIESKNEIGSLDMDKDELDNIPASDISDEEADRLANDPENQSGAEVDALIFGMPKMVAYGLGATALLGLAFLGYRIISKKA
jgi:hypothetical protein